MKLRFMTYNIQHGMNHAEFLREKKQVIDLALIAREIEKRNPDIIGLNEVRGRGSDPEYTAQVESLAAMLGYHCYFARAIQFNGTNPYGNAILSRFPIGSAETVGIPDPPVRDEDTYYETRCVLKAHFSEAGGFNVLIGHFGLAKSEQHNAVSTVAGLLKDMDEPAVIMGDFNVQPDNPILAPLLNMTEDTASVFASPKCSFPSENPNIKIDYILTKGGRPVFADIPAVVASDHCPYYADILIGSDENK